MTPTQARTFLAVALTGGFSEAARSLNVSQPTVTNQIKQIERIHEIKLFSRTRRGASLTPVGEALLPSIRRMFSSFEEAGAYLDEIRGLRRGRLRIGSYGSSDVVTMVARYRTRFPLVSVSVEFSNPHAIAEKLLSHDLDVAFGRIERRKEFHALPFRNSHLVAIAPRTSPWVGRQSISVRELIEQTVIRREPGSAARAAYDKLFEKTRPSPDRVIEFSRRDAIIGAVAENIGIGIIFDEGILPEDRVVKLTITRTAILLKVEVVCLAERKSNQLIAGFLDVANTILREARPEKSQAL